MRSLGRLPKGQRKDVGLELQELVDDMFEECGSVETVLIKLGSPADFARQYQDDRHYLIGPAYYDNYIWLLKIVLLCTLIPILITTIISGLVGMDGHGIGGLTDGVVNILVDVIVNCMTSCIGVFGGITLVFCHPGAAADQGGYKKITQDGTLVIRRNPKSISMGNGILLLCRLYRIRKLLSAGAIPLWVLYSSCCSGLCWCLRHSFSLRYSRKGKASSPYRC